MNEFWQEHWYLLLLGCTFLGGLVYKLITEFVYIIKGRKISNEKSLDDLWLKYGSLSERLAKVEYNQLKSEGLLLRIESSIVNVNATLLDIKITLAELKATNIRSEKEIDLLRQRVHRHANVLAAVQAKTGIDIPEDL